MTLADALAWFRGRRVFLTGDTGFKGSWLAFWLHQLGAEVHGYALPPERPHDLFHVLALDQLITHTDGDIRDMDALTRAVADVRPEVVLHLAAQSLVKPSYDDPVGTFETNIQGSVHLLEAVRQCPSVRSLVFVTSDKCYRNEEWPWGYRETDHLGGHDPYSASKAAAEIVLASYRDSFWSGTDAPGAASVRAGNVIGGGDWADARIVPDCIRALRGDAPIELRRPSAQRPWQHVVEPLRGYLLLARRLAEQPRVYSEPWNFGPRPESIRTVLDVATGITAAWGDTASRIVVGDVPFHETQLLCLSIDKALRKLDWRPRWDFDTTIAMTAAWYKRHAEGADMRAVTARQLGDYLETSE